jgi:hypothetical protein
MVDNNSFGWMAGEQALVAPHMEYLRKNRWVMDFAGLPGLILTRGAAMSLRLNCSKASRPKISFEETEVKRLNGSIYLAGKPKFETLEITFYDSVKYTGGQADAGGVQSTLDNSVPTASDVMEQWRELIYQPNAGDAFGSANGYKGFAYLHMLSPQLLTPTAEGRNVDFTALSADDNIAQSWLYQGLFPQNIQYGDVDYGASDVQEITVTFRYDRALRVGKKDSIKA